MSGKKNVAPKKPEPQEKKGNAGGVAADGTVTEPLRRFAARTFDYVLYLELMVWAQALAGVYMGNGMVLLGSAVLALLVMFCLEPLLLCSLGTTPGKALLGLSVTGKNGKRLSYGKGIARMDSVFSQGLGWAIPIWAFVKLWKCYRRGAGGEAQVWDKSAPVRQKKGTLLVRITAFVLACVLLLAVDTVVMRCAELPGNRGDLTVAEFSENFTRQTSVWGVAFTQVLNGEGRWEYRDYDVKNGLTDGVKKELPFTYTVDENGRLTAVTVTASRDGAEEPLLKMPVNQIIVAVSAFVWAQKDAPLWGGERMEFLQEIVDRGMSDYDLEQAGVSVSCETKLEGFRLESGKLTAEENAPAYHAEFTFTMRLKD